MVILDREEEEGLETEAIHMMIYIESLRSSGSGTICMCIASTTQAKTREKYCVQCIHLRATPITKSFIVVRHQRIVLPM